MADRWWFGWLLAALVSLVVFVMIRVADAQPVEEPPAEEPATEEGACPEGFVCLTEEEYALVHAKLTELAAIEESQPDIQFTEPLVIITDEKGRIFSNATGEIDNLIPGELKWGHMSAELKMEVELEVKRKEPPIGGLRFRPKLVASWLILQSNLTDPMLAVDVGVDFDFLYIWKWNLSAYVGGRSFGADIGFDVFRNSGIAAGVRWTWPKEGLTPQITPGVGWYFAF